MKVGSSHPVEGFVLKLLTRLESESSCQINGMDVHVEIEYNDDNNQRGSNAKQYQQSPWCTIMLGRSNTGIDVTLLPPHPSLKASLSCLAKQGSS